MGNLNPSTPPPKPSHLVFVDFENVLDVDLDTIGEMPVVVTLLIGKHQTKVGSGLFAQAVRRAMKLKLWTADYAENADTKP